LTAPIKYLATSQEEVPFVLVDGAFSHLKLDAHLHGEKEFMPLEEGSTSLLVHL
jgi:hypothetical protein